MEHDPEKWAPVFGKGLSPRMRGSCSANNGERDDDSKMSHPADGRALQPGMKAVVPVASSLSASTGVP